MGNAGNGILLNNSSHNIIGAAAAGNRIAYNDLDGVFVESGTNNGIHENSIFGNGGLASIWSPNFNQAAPVLTSGANRRGWQPGSRHTHQPTEDGVHHRVLRQRHKRAIGSCLSRSVEGQDQRGRRRHFTSNHFLAPLGANFITATATDRATNTSELSNAIS